MHLIHGALLVYPKIHEKDARATLTMPRMGLAAILSRNGGIAQAKLIQIDGDPNCIAELTEAITDFDKTHSRSSNRRVKA